MLYVLDNWSTLEEALQKYLNSLKIYNIFISDILVSLKVKVLSEKRYKVGNKMWHIDTLALFLKIQMNQKEATDRQTDRDTEREREKL